MATTMAMTAAAAATVIRSSPPLLLAAPFFYVKVHGVIVVTCEGLGFTLSFLCEPKKKNS